MTWPRWHQWPQRSRPVRSCKASWICPWRNDKRGVRGLQAPTQMHSIMSLAKVEDGWWQSWTSFWSCNDFWGLTGIRWVSARTYLQTRNLYRIIMNPFQTRRFKWSKHHPNIEFFHIFFDTYFNRCFKDMPRLFTTLRKNPAFYGIHHNFGDSQDAALCSSGRTQLAELPFWGADFFKGGQQVLNVIFHIHIIPYIYIH